jgi:hypothetical protein
MCVSCEQLLDDDCMELDALLASVPHPDPAKRTAEEQEVWAHELHEMFSTSI